MSQVIIPESLRLSANSPIRSASVSVPQAGRNIHVRLSSSDWSLPATLTLVGELAVEESFDNGAHWQDSAATPFQGGDVTPPKFGQPGGLLPDLATSLIGAANHLARLRLTINQDVLLGLVIDIT